MIKFWTELEFKKKKGETKKFKNIKRCSQKIDKNIISYSHEVKIFKKMIKDRRIYRMIKI